jgi:hypothetical protein
METNPDPGGKSSFRELSTIFWVKNLKFFENSIFWIQCLFDPGIRVVKSGSGMENPDQGYWINIPVPQHP